MYIDENIKLNILINIIIKHDKRRTVWLVYLKILQNLIKYMYLEKF
jgi:hypothetical protein